MKVGDLVYMPGSIGCRDGEDMVLGVVVSSSVHPENREMIEVFWSEEQEVSWEPTKWLEVLNESTC